MKNLRSVLLFAAVVLLAAATVLAVSGGFRTTVGGFRVSARSPVPAATAAALVGAWWWWLARQQQSLAGDLEAAWAAIDRHASRLIGIIALIAAVLAASFATRSAAGADASGYLSEAAMLARGARFQVEPLAADLTDVDGWITTPLGWRPAMSNLQAPTYPPGLPMLLAIPQQIGGIDGATAVIVASAAMAVWGTGMLAGGVAGVIAALLLAVSPAFLYQSIQIMSDVPVTAAWMASFLLATRADRSFLSGVAAAVAALIRPNLAPLAVIPLLLVQSKLRFAIPVALAGAVLMAVQSVWYGSPFLSGYGSATELFTVENIAPNAARYPRWLLATSPVLLLAPLGFIRLRRNAPAIALGAFAVLVVAAYLAYAVFEHWSYLRFLLPALAVLAVFAGVELSAWIARSPMPWRPLLLAAVLVSITTFSVPVARDLSAFTLKDQLVRVATAAEFIDRNTPRDAVLVAGEQSGSMRYYTGRSILRWEAATPESLAKAVTTVRNHDREVYVVLDAFEEDLFRRKFAGTDIGALDWPAVVEAGTSHRTKVWRVRDRARFRKGEAIDTRRLP